MTAAAVVFVTVALIAALVDWTAVARGNRRLEYIAKPLTTLALIGVAVTVDTAYPDRRGWFVVAAVLSLAGDVFLMLPGARAQTGGAGKAHLFIAGLAAFLGAHLAYITGLAMGTWRIAGAAAAIAVVAVAVVAVGRPILRAVRRRHAGLLGPVVVYLAVLSAMVVTAGATGPWLAFAGAVTFYCSDGILAWNRFVRTQRWAPVSIMVTYHAAQAGLLLSLAF